MNFINTRIRKEIYAFAKELAGQQLHCGSWINEAPNIPASVTTCQALQFLASFKSNRFDETIADAVEWLTSPSVASSEYTYWRFAALHTARASQAALDDAINHLQEKVEAGVNHHSNSPIKEYYVACRIKHGALDSLATELVKGLIKQLQSPPKEWNLSQFSHAFAVVVLSGGKKDEVFILRCLEYLTKQSRRADGQRYWDTLVVTSYVVMNLIEVVHHWGSNSNLGRKATIIVAEGARYLAKKWDEKDFQSPPLAGGTFDDTPYNQIIVARALVETLDLSEPRWREAIIDESQNENAPALIPTIHTPKAKHELLSDAETINREPKVTGTESQQNIKHAMPLFILIVVVFGLLALACICGGIYAIFKDANANTSFDFLGFHLTSTHVGVAFVGIGLVASVIIVRSVLKKI